MDKEQMKSFIAFVARSNGIKAKRRTDYVLLSVPMKSIVDESIVFEFVVFAHRDVKQNYVAIHVCMQNEKEMHRVQVIYLNGMWRDTPYNQEVELFISNNKQNMINDEVNRYLNTLYEKEVIDEEFFPSLEKETEEKYESRLRKS